MQKSAKLNAHFCCTRALKLLSNGWHQGSSAIRRSGSVTTYEDRNAVSFDIVGAFRFIRFQHRIDEQIQRKCQEILLSSIGCSTERMDQWEKAICKWNDARGRSKLEVIEMIAAARKASKP